MIKPDDPGKRRALGTAGVRQTPDFRGEVRNCARESLMSSLRLTAGISGS